MNLGAQLNSRSDSEAFDSLYTTKRVTTPPDGVADNHPPDPQSRNTLGGVLNCTRANWIRPRSG